MIFRTTATIAITTFGAFLFLLLIYGLLAPPAHYKYYVRFEAGSGWYTNTLVMLDNGCILTDSMFQGQQPEVRCGHYWVFDGASTTVPVQWP